MDPQPLKRHDALYPPSHKEPNKLLLLSYATIVALWVGSQLMIVPYMVHLLVLVTAILYAACHHSIILLKDEPRTVNADGTLGPKVSQGETLRKEDAMQFPILGSISLFSLYLAFKFLDKELVNLMIGLYFGAVGCFALTACISPIAPTLGGRIVFEKKIKHPIPNFILDNPLDIVIDVSYGDIVTFIGSAVFCYFYFLKKHWAMNNVLGICFCLQGIERFSLGTYKIGAILLVGLFFYDIFWVFGTDVMVTVAKNLDGPIKILFPRGHNADTGKLELSLLGLGDIVIPGFFLALLLRFDAHNAGEMSGDAHAKFKKPYFHSALIAYILGLATTLYVMVAFNAAQPALLYLVPACLGSSLLCALVRGELKELFAYSEEEEEEEEENTAEAVKEEVEQTKKEK